MHTALSKRSSMVPWCMLLRRRGERFSYDDGSSGPSTNNNASLYASTDDKARCCSCESLMRSGISTSCMGSSATGGSSLGSAAGGSSLVTSSATWQASRRACGSYYWCTAAARFPAAGSVRSSRVTGWDWGVILFSFLSWLPGGGSVEPPLETASSSEEGSVAELITAIAVVA